MAARMNVRNPIFILSRERPHVLKGLVKSHVSQESKRLTFIRKPLFRSLLGYRLFTRKIPGRQLRKGPGKFSIYSYPADISSSFYTKAISGRTAEMKNNVRKKKYSRKSWKFNFFINTLMPIITWCVQVRRSPKEAFAAAMQSWRERYEKCVCLQGDYVEKWLHFQLPVVSSFLNKLGDLRTWTQHVDIYTSIC